MNIDILQGGLTAYLVLAFAFALPGIARLLEMSVDETPHELGELLSPIATWIISVYSFYQWGAESAAIVFVATRLGRLAFSGVYELTYNTRNYKNPFATFTKGYNPPPEFDRVSLDAVASETCSIVFDLPARNKLVSWTGPHWKPADEVYAPDSTSELTKRRLASFDWHLYRRPRMFRKKHQSDSVINLIVEAVSLPQYSSLLDLEKLKAAASYYVQIEMVEPFHAQGRKDRILKPSTMKASANGELLTYSQRCNIHDTLHYIELAQFVALDEKHMLVFRVDYFRHSDNAEPPSIASWISWLQNSWQLQRKAA